MKKIVTFFFVLLIGISFLVFVDASTTTIQSSVKLSTQIGNKVLLSVSCKNTGTTGYKDVEVEVSYTATAPNTTLSVSDAAILNNDGSTVTANSQGSNKILLYGSLDTAFNVGYEVLFALEANVATASSSFTFNFESTCRVFDQSNPGAGANPTETSESAISSLNFTGGTEVPIQTGKAKVYRFFNKNNGAHLYTISEDEKATVLGLTDKWQFEGDKYQVEASEVTGSVPVYRFFNTKNGAHLYTISAIERDSVIANNPEFNFEGTKYFVFETKISDSLVPVYRFFNKDNGAHVYTISEDEKNTIMTLPNFTFEGVKFYVYTL